MNLFTAGCIGLRYLSRIRGKLSSGTVNNSHAEVIPCSIRSRGSARPVFFIWGVSLLKATSIFDMHRFIVSRHSATSSTLFSQSRPSDSSDRKINSASFVLVWIGWVSLPLRSGDSCISIVIEEIFLWSIVCCTRCIVCWSPVSMLDTTNPSLSLCG